MIGAYAPAIVAREVQYRVSADLRCFKFLSPNWEGAYDTQSIALGRIMSLAISVRKSRFYRGVATPGAPMFPARLPLRDAGHFSIVTRYRAGQSEEPQCIDAPTHHRHTPAHSVLPRNATPY